MRNQFLLITILGFGLLGCQPSPDYSVSINDSASVINGSKIGGRISKAAKSVVLIELLDASGVGRSYCTATLVGPHTVLTAGHCLDPARVRGLSNFRVLFTNSYSEAATAESRRGVYFKKHPLYHTEKTYDHDIGIGVFAGNIPAGFNAVDIDSDLNANYANEKVYVYGYGRTVDYEDAPSKKLRYSSGDLHKGTLIIAPEYNQFADRYHVLAESPSQICQGDSGGPQFYNEHGVLKVVGVNSAVGGDLLENGMRRCRAWSQATKVAPAYDWFKKEERKGLRKL